MNGTEKGRWRVYVTFQMPPQSMFMGILTRNPDCKFETKVRICAEGRICELFTA